MFALGVILIATKVGNAHLDVQHALMGEISFIPWNTVSLPIMGDVPVATLMLMIVLIVVLVVIGAFYKDKEMMGLSAGFGFVSAIIGYYFALWIDTSISGSMAFATGVLFFISFIFSPRHGLLANWLKPSTIKS